MTGPRTEKLVEHALAQMTLAQIESPEKAGAIRDSLAAWRQQSPEHDSAYREALRQSDALDAVAPALRDRFVKPAASRNRPARNRLLSIVAVTLAALACLAAGLEWRDRQPVFNERYTTGAAQLMTVPLPDGSHIDLSAQSTLSVTLYRNRRDVVFERGEARFEVAADAGRVFTVQMREAKVEVVGTIFSVSDRGGATSVAVEKGRVNVTLVASPVNPIALVPGSKLTVRDGIAGPVGKLAPERMASWRRGWLVFENEPLPDALAAINAFRSKPIRIVDTPVAGLRLTGSFPANESNEFVTALPQILPVEVSSTADGSVEIALRH